MSAFIIEVLVCAKTIRKFSQILSDKLDANVMVKSDVFSHF